MSRSKDRVVKRAMRPWSSARSGRRILAHIMGASESETPAEIRIVTARVIANSWKSRPTTSPMKSSGISTAMSEMVRETMVNPIWADPFRAAASGRSPCSM